MVFMQGVYLYGARRRCNAGFGLWQLAQWFGVKPIISRQCGKNHRADYGD
ncbi:Mu-like prophage major head subunit gpT family protein [Kingella kingae]|nr:Mu-like prophage major head subunit gpT family protein [Kingella kingae]